MFQMIGGYRGDTFGAMSVGLTSGFLCEDGWKNSFISYPEIWNGKNDIESNEQKSCMSKKTLNNMEAIAAYW